MSELLLFHHAQGLTPGVLAFADDLRAAGHTVHTPDLYGGRTFDSLDDGVAYARELGFGKVTAKALQAAEGLPEALVYAGFSLGAAPAQQLAQTRAGARGALLLHGVLPPSEFGVWPAALPAQVHAMQDDPYYAEDADAARELLDAAPRGELFLYPGAAHLFTDRSLPAYDAGAAALLKGRVLAFLADL